jgi:uridine phosphorylase
MTLTPPILEFDPDRKAIVNPHNKPGRTAMPPRVVLCFFQDILTRLRRQGRLKVIGRMVSEIGSNPILLIEGSGEPLAVAHPGVGAPLAAGFLEELIYMGGRYFIACGGCGVLDEQIALGHPVVISSAVRDEGTSYHYLPPGREVQASPAAVQALEVALKQHNMEYRVGKTWTTDALYRETHARRAQRVAEGCSVVEMEAAALFAVAAFRGVTIGQVVYGGDLVVPAAWDSRDWVKAAGSRELLFHLAVEACRRLEA